MTVPARFTTDRIQALSDGIYGFAMTLLVATTLDVPQLPEGGTQSDLAIGLAALLSRFWVVVLSFVLLGIFWRVHHVQYHSIRYSTDGLVWLNLATLLCVVLLPFSTELVGEHGDYPLACIVFQVNMLLIGLLALAQWRYAVRNKLLGAEVTADSVRIGTLRNLVVPAVSVVAIALAPWLAAYSCWAYVLAIPATRLLRHRSVEPNEEHVLPETEESR